MSYSAPNVNTWRETSGSLSKKITDELALIEAEFTNILDGIDITGPWSIGGSGDTEGIALTDSSEKALEAYGELPATGDAIGAGEVIYATRSRLLINKAQKNNVSLYGSSGHLRVKADMADGVHAGLYGYWEQSGTVALGYSAGSFNAAANLGVEGSSGLTVDANSILAGCVITSVVDSGATINGVFNGMLIQKAAGKKDWAIGINVEDSTVGISVSDATVGLEFIGVYPTSAIQLGTSGSMLSLAANDDHAIDINTTSPSTAAGSSVRPLHMISTMTGIGGVGGRAEFEMATNVALGGWANAIKGFANFGSSGAITGLASAIVAELTMPNAAQGGGNYTCFEAELNLGASTTVGAGTSFLRASANGTLTNFQAGGYVFDFQGLGSADTSKIFQTNTDQPTHAVRMRIGSTDYFMLLTDADNGSE